MSLMTPYEILISCLAERLLEGRVDYVPQAVAYQRLKEMTGQDFGFDVEKWKEWLVERDLIRLINKQ